MSATPFGRYLLLEEIARGGMAVVYRAVLRDSAGFEKQVALKRMLRELGDDPEFVVRFTDEARIVSTLTHANIAQVFDFGQVDGEHFLVMELVDGPDLGALFAACERQGQPVPIPTAIHVVAQMTRGLGYAHGRRDARGDPAPVVHRDVSPQNTLISRSGEVKVVDFGIAKAADKAHKTRTGMVMGKCRHMAPEQATGDSVDPRADVFASGTVLFEALTGRPLFSGGTVNEVLGAVLYGPIPAASAINPEVPPEIDEILARALARDPQGRYADGSAMARDLEALLHRMAPDHSVDDLARFVGIMVPPPERSKWQAAVTVQDPGGPQGLSATVARGARRSGPQDVGPGPTLMEPSSAVAQPVVTTPLTFEPTGVTRPETPGALQPPGPAPGDRDEKDKARRWLWLGAAAGLAALLLGLSGRAIVTGSLPRAQATSGRPGQTIRHHGWELTLDRVQAVGDVLQVRVNVVPAETSSLGDVRFSLVDDLRDIPPLFTSRSPGAPGALVLVFRPSGTSPRLRFIPPHAPPLLLALEGR